MRMRKPSSYSSSSSSKSSQSIIISTTGADGGMSSSSSVVVNKNITPCCTKVGLKRGPWTPQEDQLLSDYIKIQGEGKWRALPKKAGLLRCGKSCRLRWMNYLRPSVKRGHIAPDEEDLILRLHRLLGNRWSLIAGRIPGRTDNEIKNYWNTHLSKKLISQGIDPRTHKPLEPNHSSNQNKFSSDDHILADPNSSSVVVPSPLIVEEDTAAIGGIKPGDHDQFQSAEMRDIEKEKENDENNNMQTNGDGDHVGYGMSIDHQEGFSNELYDDEDMNYCSDDIFSSFLNSLINEEDVFNSQNTVEEQQPNNDDDLMISTTQIFKFGPGWEAPVMGCASNSQLHENDSKRVVNGEDEN